MKRTAEELALMKKRARLRNTVLGKSDNSPHKYRKRAPLDCGRPQCGLCHSSKLHKRPTHKSVKADEALAAQLEDAGLS